MEESLLDKGSFAHDEIRCFTLGLSSALSGSPASPEFYQLSESLETPHHSLSLSLKRITQLEKGDGTHKSLFLNQDGVLDFEGIVFQIEKKIGGCYVSEDDWVHSIQSSEADSSPSKSELLEQRKRQYENGCKIMHHVALDCHRYLMTLFSAEDGKSLFESSYQKESLHLFENYEIDLPQVVHFVFSKEYPPPSLSSSSFDPISPQPDKNIIISGLLTVILSLLERLICDAISLYQQLQSTDAHPHPHARIRKIPRIFREVLEDKDLFHVIWTLSPAARIVLQLVVGLPSALNLRNLWWHGFITPFSEKEGKRENEGEENKIMEGRESEMEVRFLSLLVMLMISLTRAILSGLRKHEPSTISDKKRRLMDLSQKSTSKLSPLSLLASHLTFVLDEKDEEKKGEETKEKNEESSKAQKEKETQIECEIRNCLISNFLPTVLQTSFSFFPLPNRLKVLRTSLLLYKSLWERKEKKIKREKGEIDNEFGVAIEFLCLALFLPSFEQMIRRMYVSLHSLSPSLLLASGDVYYAILDDFLGSDVLDGPRMFLKRSQGASIFHHLETSSETTKNSRDKLLEKDKLERGIALRVQEGKERKKLGKGNKNGEKKGESASVEIKRNMIPDLIGRGPFRALVDSLNTPSGVRIRDVTAHYEVRPGSIPLSVFDFLFSLLFYLCYTLRLAQKTLSYQENSSKKESRQRIYFRSLCDYFDTYCSSFHPHKELQDLLSEVGISVVRLESFLCQIEKKRGEGEKREEEEEEEEKEGDEEEKNFYIDCLRKRHDCQIESWEKRLWKDCGNLSSLFNKHFLVPTLFSFPPPRAIEYFQNHAKKLESECPSCYFDNPFALQFCQVVGISQQLRDIRYSQWCLGEEESCLELSCPLESLTWLPPESCSLRQRSPQFSLSLLEAPKKSSSSTSPSLLPPSPSLPSPNHNGLFRVPSTQEKQKVMAQVTVLIKKLHSSLPMVLKHLVSIYEKAMTHKSGRGRDTFSKMVKYLPSLFLSFTLFGLFCDVALRTAGTLASLPWSSCQMIHTLLTSPNKDKSGPKISCLIENQPEEEESGTTTTTTTCSLPPEQECHGCFLASLHPPLSLLRSGVVVVDRMTELLAKNEWGKAVQILCDGQSQKKSWLTALEVWCSNETLVVFVKKN